MPPQSTGSCRVAELRNCTPNSSSEGKLDKKIVSSEEAWNCWDHLYPYNIFWFSVLHMAGIYGIKVAITDAQIATLVFGFVIYNFSMFGITAGVHRLWSHRAYKATFIFRVFLALCNSAAYQNSIFEWVRDHRVHHKYTETNADPHNSKRGFFFSHVGWLLCKKHPDVSSMGCKVDMSDILADPVVVYQKRYYILSVGVMCFALPAVVPWYFWGETLWNAFFVVAILRYVVALNTTWLVNSAAHKFGHRPYDKDIAAAENIVVSALTLGEGYHNFHHTFPWDYSTSEWGWRINLTTVALDFFEKVGLIYDVKRVTPEIVKARIARTGAHGHDIVEKSEYMWVDDLKIKTCLSL